MRKPNKYKVFLSYARANNQNTNGLISKLKTMIEKQISEVCGNKINIFKDDEVLDSGAKWEEEINKTIDEEALILIALITPSFFNSQNCHEEIGRFLQRENKLGRSDLIIPIYLIDVDEIKNKLKNRKTNRKNNNLADILLQRNLVDFRELYKNNFHKRQCAAPIRKLAQDVKKVFDVFNKIGTRKISSPKLDKNPPINKIITPDETEYRLRKNHFEQEKVFLAEKFGDYLWARLKNLNQPVILLIDSGTTLFHFFKKIGNLAIKSSKDDWIKNLIVITNNLAGVRWLMHYGRENKSRWSEIILKCILLPGTPLTTYGATTSLPENDPFFEELKILQPHLILEELKKTRNYKIISLATGNWIRIRESFPRYPIPLARGRGHLDIKQSMIDLADEVYVIAPLGKIFADLSKSKVKTILHYFVESQKTKGDIYHEVEINAEPIIKVGKLVKKQSINKIRLITTSRPEHSPLSNLSNLLENDSFLKTLKVTEDNFEQFKGPFFISEFEKVSNLMFLFENKSKSLTSQIKQDFPHKNSWNYDFLSCFHIHEELISSFLKSVKK